MDENSLKFNSRTIHGGQKPDKAYGAVMPPIYQTSTFAQSHPGGHQGYEYSRSGNPTRSALENSLASIENGNYGLAFASGLAAMDAVIKLLKPGDEVIVRHSTQESTHLTGSVGSILGSTFLLEEETVDSPIELGRTFPDSSSSSSSSFGVEDLIVPIQKKQSSPTILFFISSKLIKSDLIISIRESSNSGFIRTKSFIFCTYYSLVGLSVKV